MLVHFQWIYAQNNLDSITELNTQFVLESTPETKFLDVNGFIESRMGYRTQNDLHQELQSIAECRFQLKAEQEIGRYRLNFATDLLLDPAGSQIPSEIYKIDLKTGKSVLDIRQANVLFSPFSFVDVKIGRQILTWGTGDLLFINDLFSKDWRSFFLGRDMEYLKSPSNTIKVSLFSSIADLDLVYTPQFNPDRFIDGSRISFFDLSIMDFRGQYNPLPVDIPGTWFKDDEIALRIYRSFEAHELTLYNYHGFWKSPTSIDPTSGLAIFPGLSVYGASYQGSMGGGIANLEFGFYDSKPTSITGDAPTTHDELRWLLGYEKEVKSELTLGVQYNLEHRLNREGNTYDKPGSEFADKNLRHIITLRATQVMSQQNLNISLFNFFSPSDKDGYLRMQSSYKLSDKSRIDGGVNLFYGKEEHTFFNQFKYNSNVYLGFRYVY